MKAVILAGGKGTRLSPYTTILPKPLMPIGEMPILEVLIRQLKRAGVNEVILTVGHLSELLKAFFKDGRRFGVDISYSQEEKPLGTAGPLGLIRDQLDEPFFVLNGDVLTTLSFSSLMSRHKRSGALATIAMHKRSVRIDFGVLEMGDDHQVVDYIEKPSIPYQVSMGVYAFDPKILNFIPDNAYLDFPDLVLNLIHHNLQVDGYLFDGYWQDLGRPDDYAKASQDFETMREKFLPVEEA